MKERRSIAENGQTVVLVALLMVGLLATTGLAVDGGTAFLERRRMQNAADGAAMAGARNLVMSKIDEDTFDDTAIQGTVLHYAEANGVEDAANNFVAHYVDKNSAVLAAVGDGSIPSAATGISATVRIERPSRFMQVVGLDIVPAQAFSLAQTGPPDYEAGVEALLRPFGMPTDVFSETLTAGSLITFTFGNKCGPEAPGNVCNIFWTTALGEQSRAHRGWNYNEINVAHCSASGGASVEGGLMDYMKNGWRGELGKGDKVCSKPGVNASAFNKAPKNKPICIPVYDYFDDKRYLVHAITPVIITDFEKHGNFSSITVKLWDEPTECTLRGQADPGDPLTYNDYTITQWE
jgi:hypothetical protein